ncbi:hypothetical protein HG535_0C04540 [Zygotorulaspora mrakii]|uniref:Arrestin C-terminal-like domain-containing protein n=1 Tax=Zygotorulaspora mrakii TaxID=42260 RepID=A0A7H9B0F2_ZYGMR|nr:uncharacterized protein HG535_0C04540 [Zygotorulaspora mrakii]QLG72100.1 hypothetical protein HG535_0C04540 [Zygotorulaspora mrakii]
MFPSSKAKEPLLYDVRIKGTDHDVILLKGTNAEAPSVLLSGTIVLSVQEPIQIKNLSLRLYGRIRLNILTPYQSSKGPAQRYVKYEKRIYEHTWDNFDVDTYFQNLYDNYGKAAITSKSSVNLSSLPKKARSSTASLMSLTGQSSSNYHTLVKGNYEFPFSAILPGSLTESVEGLPNASVVYKLEATIERVKFYTDLICRKHLRVVRTLSPAALELSETVAVDNTWPKKVDYSISVPAKAIAIGSSTPINILVVPLLKGLKLGPVKISLVESSQYCGSFGSVCTQERTVSKIRLKDPLSHMSGCTEPLSVTENDDSAYQDRWEVHTLLHIPPSLSKCTQDCTLLNSIKVRHKIKFIISLVNPDGHVSELRASLPVQLFISPFVPLGVKTVDGLYGSANNSSTDFNDVRSCTKDPESDDEMIFARSASEIELSNNNQNNVSVAASLSEMMSPPNYGKHIYDRLWSDLSNANTPPLSGAHTPIEELQGDGNNSTGSVLDTQENVNELQMNLQRLRLERENDVPGLGLPSTPSEQEQSNGNTALLQPPRPGLRNIQSPSMTPGFSHISRQNSFTLPPGSSPAKKDWELGTLSRVPSYDKAMKSDMIGDDLPPVYHVLSKDNNKGVLERPQIVHHKSASSVLATSNGTQMSQAAFTRSNNSSSTSLSQSQTNGSSTNLANNMPSSNKGQTASRYFSFGMTPVENSDSTTSLHLQRSSSKGNLQRSTGSLSNLMGLLSKKEKK